MLTRTLTEPTALPPGYRPHPFAEMFPLIKGDAFWALVLNIQEYGVQQPVVMLDGMILDGRNRWRAAHQCDDPPIPIPTVEYQGDNPLGYVISANIHRRHLNASQLAMVAAKIAKIGRGGDQRSDHSANLRNEPTAAEAATMLNISTRSVETARVVRDRGTPELIAEVEAGRVSVSAAAEVAKLPEAEQVEIVAGGKKGIVAKAKEQRAAKAGKPATPPTQSQDDIDIATRLLAGDSLQEVCSTLNENRSPREKRWVRLANVKAIRTKLRQEGKLPDPRREQERAKLRAKIEAELRAELRRIYDEIVLPETNRQHEHAQAIIASHKGLMSRADYRKVLSCLHPDSVADESRKPRFAEAFQIIRDLESVLVKPDAPTTSGTPLPQTTIELLARKAEADARKAEERAAKRQTKADPEGDPP